MLLLSADIRLEVIVLYPELFNTFIYFCRIKSFYLNPSEFYNFPRDSFSLPVLM